MKQVTMLDNGMRVEIDGNRVRIIGQDGNALYDSAPIYGPKDAFSHFFLMGENERWKVENWLSNALMEVPENNLIQRIFLERVRIAINVIDYDYYIATLEPSFDKDGNIFYEEGNTVAGGIKAREWARKARNYYSGEEWHSELAKLEEGDLFKAYRIAMGYWTLEYVCNDSSAEGNFWDSVTSSQALEVSGAREVGGFKDGVGNTYDIYQTEFGFALVGGYYRLEGSKQPLMSVLDYMCTIPISDAVGVLVLKRNSVH